MLFSPCTGILLSTATQKHPPSPASFGVSAHSDVEVPVHEMSWLPAFDTGSGSPPFDVLEGREFVPNFAQVNKPCFATKAISGEPQRPQYRTSFNFINLDTFRMSNCSFARGEPVRELRILRRDFVHNHRAVVSVYHPSCTALYERSLYTVVNYHTIVYVTSPIFIYLIFLYLMLKEIEPLRRP